MNGVTGLQGYTGCTGPTGYTGYTGIQGVTGYTSSPHSSYTAAWAFHHELHKHTKLKETLYDLIGADPIPSPHPGDTGPGGGPPGQEMERVLEILPNHPDIIPLITGINPWLDRQIGEELNRERNTDKFPDILKDHCMECGGYKEIMKLKNGLSICRWCVRKSMEFEYDIENPTAKKKSFFNKILSNFY